MNKEQKTIKAIQKAVPEILKRELDIQKILEKYFVVFDGRDNDSANDIIIELSRKLNKITLEDVMIAIEDQSISFRYFYKDKLYIQIEKAGKILGIWKLNKPFTEQSKETKELIGDLILK